MKVFLAGATGVIGRQLLPRLTAAAHEVTGMTRSPEKSATIREAGAEPVVCDVFDTARLTKLLSEMRPAAVIHELTDLPQEFDIGKLIMQYKANNRIRREGTKNLVRAASQAGVRRFIVQSMASWYKPGPGLKREDDPLYIDARKPLGEAVRALKYMEDVVLESGMEPIILRYGGFYGPGTWFEAGGAAWQEIRQRKFPMIGGGKGIASWIHVEDAAVCTVAALERARPGIYNVVDDEPSPAREWLPACAAAIGAKPPRNIPLWIARWQAGGIADWQSKMPGASNEKIKREINWQPRYPSGREGLMEELRKAPLRKGAGA